VGPLKIFFKKKLHKKTLAPCRLYKNKEPGKTRQLKTKSLNLFFQNSVANLSWSRLLFSFNSLFKEKNSALCFWTLQWFFFGVCVRDFFCGFGLSFSLYRRRLCGAPCARAHTRTQHNLRPFFAPREIITMAWEAWQRLSWCGFLGGAGGDILCAVEDYIGIHSRVKKKRNKKRSRGRRSGRAFTYHDFLIKFNQDDEVVCCWSSSR
jgi:hypothetical protein